MFKSKKPSNLLKLEHEKFETLIGCETTITGDVVLCQSIRIDGVVAGNLKAEPDTLVSVVVGQSGRVLGNIMAHRILVAGLVQGDIEALDRLELAGSACVRGDVKYATLAIEHGADVQGGLNKADAKTQNGSSSSEYGSEPINSK